MAPCHAWRISLTVRDVARRCTGVPGRRPDASAYPSRVFKGMKMSGRMGGNRVTQPGLVVHEVDPERNLLLVRGSVPGAASGLLEILGA